MIFYLREMPDVATNKRHESYENNVTHLIKMRWMVFDEIACPRKIEQRRKRCTPGLYTFDTQKCERRARERPQNGFYSYIACMPIHLIIKALETCVKQKAFTIGANRVVSLYTVWAYGVNCTVYRHTQVLYSAVRYPDLCSILKNMFQECLHSIR